MRASGARIPVAVRRSPRLAERGPWAALPARGRVELTGWVSEVSYPAATAPAIYTVMLAPDVPPPGGRRLPAPTVRLQWLGQRDVPGVDVGAWLTVSGMLTTQEDAPVMFDPSYEILAPEEETP